MKYVICFNNIVGLDKYYTGRTFIFQGEHYASATDDIAKAKQYTSRRRAENARKKLIDRWCFDAYRGDEKYVTIEEMEE